MDPQMPTQCLAVQANGPFVSSLHSLQPSRVPAPQYSTARRWPLLLLQVPLSSGFYRRISGNKTGENSRGDGSGEREDPGPIFQAVVPFLLPS